MAWGIGEPAPKPAFAEKSRESQREKKRRWTQIYRAVMKRDQRCCRVCRSRDDVEAHHIKFRSTGGEDSTANVAAICRVCHAAIHAYRLSVSGNADKRLKIEWLKSGAGV